MAGFVDWSRLKAGQMTKSQQSWEKALKSCLPPSIKANKKLVLHFSEHVHKMFGRVPV